MYLGLSASKCTLSNHHYPVYFNVVFVNVGSSSVEVGDCVLFLGGTHLGHGIPNFMCTVSL